MDQRRREEREREGGPWDGLGGNGRSHESVDGEGAVEGDEDHEEGKDDDEVVVVEVKGLVEQEEIAEHEEEAEGEKVVEEAHAHEQTRDHHGAEEELHVGGISKRDDPLKVLVLVVEAGLGVDVGVHLGKVILCPHERLVAHEQAPKDTKHDDRTRVDGLKLVTKELLDLL